MGTAMRRPEDVVTWARQRYVNQRRRWLDGLGEWPLRLSLLRPNQDAAVRNPVAVRAWSEAWAAWTPPCEGVSLETETVAWQRMGTQTLPHRVSFLTPGSIAHSIREGLSWNRAVLRRDRMVRRWPQLAITGLGTHFDVLADWNDQDFERLLALLEWLEVNPRSNLYLRQLPVHGIDTKWIDLHRRGVVSDLFRRLRSHVRILGDDGEQMPALDFYQTCGLRRPPVRLRVLFLCPNLRCATGGLRDIEAPLEQLRTLALAPRRALVVENLETAYALPDFAGSVAFVKLGAAVSLISQLPWMATVPVTYWGDIDTHGFHILAQARQALGNVTSSMMDPATLAEFRERCIPEPNQMRNANVSILTLEEAAAYRGLLDGTWGHFLRLEQERIDWSYATTRLTQALFQDRAAG